MGGGHAMGKQRVNGPIYEAIDADDNGADTPKPGRRPVTAPRINEYKIKML